MPDSQMDSDGLLTIAFEEKLGINRQRFIRHIRLVKLMAWEQVFLAAYYARLECITSRSCVHFTDRLRLLRLGQRKNAEQFLALGQWLDEGLGFLALSERMKSEGFKGAEDFLSACEEEQIVFPSLRQKTLYPHITMLAALENIVEVFQTLLEGYPPEQWCDAMVLAKINKQHPHITRRSEGIAAQINHRNARFSSLPEALATIPEDFALGLTIQREMDKALATWMTKAFDRLRCPYPASQGDNQTAITVRQGIAQFSQNVHDNELSITFDREHLVRCMALGQGQKVMDAINEELTGYLGKSVFQSRSTTPSDSHHETLSAWYRGCGVLGLKNEKSIPAKLATLLDFDIQHAHWPLVFLHPYIRHIDHIDLPEKVSLPDAALITTTLIDRCLFHTEEVSQCLSVETDFRWDEAVKTLTRQQDKMSDENTAQPAGAPEDTRAPRAQGSEPRPDRLMETWSDREASKIAERFKRPRKKVWGEITSVVRLINEQKKQAMDYRYPIEGPFPLPLWS